MAPSAQPVPEQAALPLAGPAASPAVDAARGDQGLGAAAIRVNPDPVEFETQRGDARARLAR